MMREPKAYEAKVKGMHSIKNSLCPWILAKFNRIRCQVR
jgi:hypothetical protein